MGLPPHCCSHTASLFVRVVASGILHHHRSPCPCKHRQVYRYLVTLTHAKSSKPDEIVTEICKLLVRACGTYSNLFIPHATRLGHLRQCTIPVSQYAIHFPASSHFVHPASPMMDAGVLSWPTILQINYLVAAGATSSSVASESR